MKKIIPLLFLFLTSCVPNQITPPNNTNNGPINNQLFSLHNQERVAKGRSPLILDPFLVQYAQQWARQMAQESKLYHSKLTFMQSGKYYTGGENIAWNQRTTTEVVKAWMNSTGHRDNILNRKFTKVGFGIAYNSKGEPYWCTVFGG